MPFGQKRMSVKPETVVRQIRLMESLDTNTSEEATYTLSIWLSEGCGIAQVLKYYISCQSIRALELLCNQVSEPYDKILLDQISDCLQKNVSGTLILLGRLISNGASWLSKLTSHEIFTKILDLIKSGKNLEHVNSALLLIASLLPYCQPSEHTVKELFRAFLDACKLYHQRNKSSMEKLLAVNSKTQLDNPFVMSHIICLMQISALKNSLTIYFGALYAIFPNSVLTLLQKCVQTSGNVEFFTNVLEPILMSCKTHPNILLENRDRELNLERWKERHPDELFALCEKVAIPETAPQFPCLSFKQQLANNIYGNQSDLNALDANTLAHFKKGCQNFAVSSQPFNRYGLSTPPNEFDDEFAEYSDDDFFDNVNFERLLNNSLTMASHSSSKHRLSPYCFLNDTSDNQTTSSQESTKSKTQSIDQVPERRLRSTLKRSPSDSKIYCSKNPELTKNVQLPWSVAKMLCDTFKKCLFENSFEKAKQTTENLCNEYIKEGENYHQQLKLLGLADRLPGKIYDDLHSIMKGLNLENQRDLLESRLRLVNHHLMFERSCRLMLSKRCHQLFERLKNQRSEDTDPINENKQLKAQLEQLNKRLQDSHNENKKLQARLQEKDHYYLNKVQTANATIDDLNAKLNVLRYRSSFLEQNAQHHQKKLESMLLEEEHRVVDDQFAEAQQEEMEHIRYELSLSRQQNQELHNRCENLMLAQNKPATHSEQLQISKQTIDTQLNSFKVQLQKSREVIENWQQRYKQLEQKSANWFEQKLELEQTVIRTAKIYALQTKSTNQKYEALNAICIKQEAHIAYIHGMLKKSTAKNVSRRKLHTAFRDVFPFEDMHNDELDTKRVNEHLTELFGDENADNLQLIDRSEELALRKLPNYVPSSSLDTCATIEPKHERRCSLTTLPISVEYKTNQDECKEEDEEQAEVNSNPSSKASGNNVPEPDPCFEPDSRSSFSILAFKV
ncbi:Hamartin [Aphelenchoides bicaudatus]|nr:Hamartin [Aphelenchoides bicaudatus]